MAKNSHKQRENLRAAPCESRGREASIGRAKLESRVRRNIRLVARNRIHYSPSVSLRLSLPQHTRTSSWHNHGRSTLSVLLSDLIVGAECARSRRGRWRHHRRFHYFLTRASPEVWGGCVASFEFRLQLRRRTDDTVTLVEGTEIAAGGGSCAPEIGGAHSVQHPARAAAFSLWYDSPSVHIGRTDSMQDWHGPATASLAELSFRLHEEYAKKHGGAKLWGYRKIGTLSISANTRSKSGKGRVPPGLEWLDSSIVKGVKTLGTKATTAQVHPRLLTTKLVEVRFFTASMSIIVRSVAHSWRRRRAPRS